MLDALYERAAAIRGARFRVATAVQEKPERYGDRKEKTISTPLWGVAREGFRSLRSQLFTSAFWSSNLPSGN